MKEAIVSQGPEVKIIDSPIPVPQKGQVLIRVVAGSNPKGVKSTFWLPPSNFGDDIAGYVESVGDGVLEFRPNDRVAAFHEMFTPHGAFAEYAIAWAHTTFRLPANISFEEAATVPLTSMTAALGLYSNLRLPLPWTTDEDRPETGPLVIYGAGAAVGSFAVQFARKSEVHPIICVAGQSKDHVETLIDSSKGDVVIDYRLGPETVLAEIKKALGGKPVLYAFDAVADYGSDKILGAFLHPESGRITMTLPKDGVKIPKKPGVLFPDGYVKPALEGVPEGVEGFWTAVGTVHNAPRHFGYIFYRYIELGLEEGWLKPHPHDVVQGGLNGLPVGLAKLLEGKAHGVKYVYRIADTKA
ncbi:chaperonin 10-like protein [Ilyonectria robusta]|uniref:chaperonin 10-like protein n=1 Tax=Ilyonectria robusta TaxID=1079257 RepID=UPI001E8CF1B1|nr:chaperonin 10-like protein [Ilyonectria robusta]KAH8654410.1 chaperonin 10-like protein [Ilyonectria robusta]